MVVNYTHGGSVNHFLPREVPSLFLPREASFNSAATPRRASPAFFEHAMRLLQRLGSTEAEVIQAGSRALRRANRPGWTGISVR